MLLSEWSLLYILPIVSILKIFLYLTEHLVTGLYVMCCKVIYINFAGSLVRWGLLKFNVVNGGYLF